MRAPSARAASRSLSQAPQSSITRASQVVRQSSRTGALAGAASTSASASVSTVRQCGGRRR